MTWDELKERQAEERAAQLKTCQDRRWELYLKQKEIIECCHFTGPKGKELLDDIFDQQRHIWHQKECDEWDALLNAHQHEREAFTNRQAAEITKRWETEKRRER